MLIYRIRNRVRINEHSRFDLVCITQKEETRTNLKNRDTFIRLIFLIFISNILLLPHAEAGLGTPSLSVSITTPSQIERGESASIAVTISET